MKFKTYEDRVAEMLSVEDIDKQIDLTRAQMMQAYARANRASFLHQKLKHKAKAKHHEDVLHQLRANRFNLEGKLKQT